MAETMGRDALAWRVAEWKASKYLLALGIQEALEAGTLELADVLEELGWSRAKWYRVLKQARFFAEGRPRDGRRRRPSARARKIKEDAIADAAGPCPHCSETWPLPAGVGDAVRCRNCGTTWTPVL